MQFGRWLRQQQDRASAVGDLARDHATPCGCHPKHPSSVQGIALVMRDHDACEGAWDAFVDAVREWAAFPQPGGQT